MQKFFILFSFISINDLFNIRHLLIISFSFINFIFIKYIKYSSIDKISLYITKSNFSRLPSKLRKKVLFCSPALLTIVFL